MRLLSLLSSLIALGVAVLEVMSTRRRGREIAKLRERIDLVADRTRR